MVLPRAARPAALAARLGDAPALRAEVEQMLEADAAPGALEEDARIRLRDTWIEEAIAEADTDDPPPETLGGFRVLGVLGRGASGTVFEAEQAVPARRVAVKRLHLWLLAGRDAARFQAEAEALAALLHPGIPQVYAFGEDAGRPWLAMELVRGEPVTMWAASQGLSRRARASLLARVCDAAHHAHLRGFVHRDLKPANVLVGEDGQPKIVDFGVAARVERPDGSSVGTLPYMAPEQLAASATVDLRADVYALGVLGFVLLTGRHPLGLDRAVPDAKERVLAGRTEPARVDPDLDAVLARCLARNPERRYASAAELAGDLRACLEGRPVTARVWTRRYLLARFVGRHRLATTLTLGLLAALSTAVVVALAQGRAAEVARAEATAEASRARAALAAARQDRARQALERGDPGAALADLGALHADRVDTPAVRFLTALATRARPVVLAAAELPAVDGWVADGAGLVGFVGEAPWRVDPAAGRVARREGPGLVVSAQAPYWAVTRDGRPWRLSNDVVCARVVGDTVAAATADGRVLLWSGDGVARPPPIRVGGAAPLVRCEVAGGATLLTLDGAGALVAVDLPTRAVRPLHQGDRDDRILSDADGRVAVVAAGTGDVFAGRVDRPLRPVGATGFAGGVFAAGRLLVAGPRGGIALVREGEAPRLLLPADGTRWGGEAFRVATAPGAPARAVFPADARFVVVDPVAERIVAAADVAVGDPLAAVGAWLVSTSRGEGFSFLRPLDVAAPAEPVPDVPCAQALVAGPRGVCVGGDDAHVVTVYDRATGGVLDRREGPTFWYGFDYPEPDAEGRRVLLGSSDRSPVAGVWSVGGGLVPLEIDAPVRDLAWSPDGAWAVGVDPAGHVHVWDAATGRLVRSLTAAAAGLFVVAWSPDGAWIAAGGETGAVYVWPAAAPSAPPRRLGGFDGYVNALAFDATGAHLIAASRDLTARVFEVATGAAGPPLGPHRLQASRVGFLPDGLAWTAERKGPLSVWDPNGGELVLRIEDATSPTWTAEGLRYLQGRVVRLVATGAAPG